MAKRKEKPFTMELYHACVRKNKFANVGEVKKAIEKSQSYREVPLYWYRCPHCGYYHMTKNPQGKKNARSNHSRGADAEGNQ